MNSCPREQSANRPRGSRSSIPSRSSTAAAIPPSARRATPSSSRPTSSATATRSCAPSCAGAARARRTGTRRRCATSTPRHAGVRWEGRSPSTEPGRWTWTIEAWTDAFASWREELDRKVAAGSDDLAGELSEGVLLLERVAGRAEGDGPRDARAGAQRRRATPPAPTRTRAEAALGARPARRRRSDRTPTALESTILPQPARARRRPRARPLRRLVRAVPALVGRLRRRPRQLPAPGRARLRRPLPAADPPDRRTNRKGAQQRARRRPPATPAARGRSATRPAATTRSTPTSARSTTFDALVADGPPRRHRDRARLRDPVLGRPPVADRAPRVVQPPPRRHAEVRREPAQEVPGHLQRQLSTREDWRGLWQALLRRRPASGSTHGVRVFRVDNPHTKPLPFWEWLIAEVRGAAPRRGLPRRGVHARGR